MGVCCSSADNVQENPYRLSNKIIFAQPVGLSTIADETDSSNESIQVAGPTAAALATKETSSQSVTPVPTLVKASQSTPDSMAVRDTVTSSRIDPEPNDDEEEEDIFAGISDFDDDDDDADADDASASVSHSASSPLMKLRKKTKVVRKRSSRNGSKRRSRSRRRASKRSSGSTTTGRPKTARLARSSQKKASSFFMGDRRVRFSPVKARDIRMFRSRPKIHAGRKKGGAGQRSLTPTSRRRRTPRVVRRRLTRNRRVRAPSKKKLTPRRSSKSMDISADLLESVATRDRGGTVSEDDKDMWDFSGDFDDADESALLSFASEATTYSKAKETEILEVRQYAEAVIGERSKVDWKAPMARHAQQLREQSVVEAVGALQHQIESRAARKEDPDLTMPVVLKLLRSLDEVRLLVITAQAHGYPRQLQQQQQPFRTSSPVVVGVGPKPVDLAHSVSFVKATTKGGSGPINSCSTDSAPPRRRKFHRTRSASESMSTMQVTSFMTRLDLARQRANRILQLVEYRRPPGSDAVPNNGVDLDSMSITIR